MSGAELDRWWAVPPWQATGLQDSRYNQPHAKSTAFLVCAAHLQRYGGITCRLLPVLLPVLLPLCRLLCCDVAGPRRLLLTPVTATCRWCEASCFLTPRDSRQSRLRTSGVLRSEG